MRRMEQIRPDRSWRGERSSRDPKQLLFGSCRGEFNAPGGIRLIRCIRRIRVEPLNLNGSPMVLNLDARL
jgi:hypothetical protein